jgi:sulfite reductase alpha subunit-like flavoprotein
MLKSKKQLFLTRFSLIELCSAGKSKLFEEKITSKCVGLIDLLQQYPSIKLTLDFIVQRCNYIMPRFYTIASSALKSPQNVRIAISLSKFSAPDG